MDFFLLFCACFESFLHNLPALHDFIIVPNLFEDSMHHFVVFLTRHISSHFKPLSPYVCV